jgi:hypothetical protein
MTATPNMRHATMIQYPLAILAWLTAIATIFARDQLPTDNQDIAVLASHLLFAISNIALTLNQNNRARTLISLPVAASLYGFIAGPAILWKLQLPVSILMMIAAYARLPAALGEPAKSHAH